MACHDEITQEEALEHDYRKDSIFTINEDTNSNKSQYVALFYLL